MYYSYMYIGSVPVYHSQQSVHLLQLISCSGYMYMYRMSQPLCFANTSSSHSPSHHLLYSTNFIVIHRILHAHTQRPQVITRPTVVDPILIHSLVKLTSSLLAFCPFSLSGSEYKAAVSSSPFLAFFWETV